MTKVKNNKSLCFIGDTHGNHNYIKWEIKNKGIEGYTLIHVGDFGVGFTNEENETKNLTSFNDFLKERNITLHVFRGNHDNPKYFKGGYLYSNLKLEPDYTILDVGDNKILGIGGAISIDRVTRKLMGKGVWDDEVFVLDEKFLNEVRGVNILVTHSAPNYAPPINIPGKWPNIVKHFINEDPTLGEDLLNERELISEALRVLKINNNITHHFYGHFHESNTIEIDNCTHRCLNINEFYVLPHMD